MFSFIGRLFNKETGQKMMKSDLESKIKEKQYYGSAVKVGESSLYASACVYDGVTEALSMIGKVN